MKPCDPHTIWPVSSSADRMNQHCFCRTVDERRLRERLADDLLQSRPHLFSSTVVFVSDVVVQQIKAVVAAIERVASLPGYQAQALMRAPAVAGHAFGPLGACMGFDFHVGADGVPQLIEVNTNAGGAMLNAVLARAQQACCEEVLVACSPTLTPQLDAIEPSLVDMFAAEWRSQRGDTALRTVLIVDDAPSEQFLAPEFELFRQLFERQGWDARIADPAELVWQDGQLRHQGAVVDLVYNRLTDFYWGEPSHQALRQAYEAGAVVVTPHPRAHALYADKRNLIALSHGDLLSTWGVSASDRQLLRAVVPSTVAVTAERADELWASRRQWFFKPVGGFGGKAAYRGDKLTRRVWGEILAGDFVAQAVVPPSVRVTEVDGSVTPLKFDIRAYSYAGQVQLLAARMYAGQTTNFRTPGGGFASVVAWETEAVSAIGAIAKI